MKATIQSLLVFVTLMASGSVSRAQAQPCSNASLRGTYGFHAFATIVPPGGVTAANPGVPQAIIGVFIMDGRGNLTANLTLNRNGQIVQLLNQSGTYVVNPDCTGTLFPAPPPVSTGGSVALMVVDGGREFYQMRTDPASIVLFGTTKKVSSGNDNEQ